MPEFRRGQRHRGARPHRRDRRTGACGIDYPLRVSALGESGPLSYDDEPVPPGSIPNSSVPRSAMPQNWPGASPAIQSNPSPPVQADAPQSYPPPQSYPATQVYPPPQSYPAPQPAAQIGGPLSLEPPGTDDDDIPGGPPHPYYGEPNAPSYSPSNSPSYSPSPYQQRLPSQAERPPAGEPVPPLGPPVPATAVSSVPVQVQPPATLACPVMSALDQWIASAVQPAAAHWFRQPVVEIKQISAYSCRGMNGNPNAHISEHAFGNALDVAEFDLADGHKISVQYGWHGSPEEQGFLHDVQAAACEQFTTVLAPGANVYHYN
ncbi:MAG: extensin family protein, partial [Xanthobacteraceae bacterium]